MGTWLGWMIDWGVPITLLGETAWQVTDAQRELARIGIDTFAAVANGTPRELAAQNDQLRSMLAVPFKDLAAARTGGGNGQAPVGVVLDVRTNNEWKAAHITEAVHIPLYELKDRLDEVPAGTVWVHCGSGYRAAAAASLLEQAGRERVLVDDLFDNADDAGLALIPAA